MLGLFVASYVLIGFVPDEVGRVDLFYEVRYPSGFTNSQESRAFSLSSLDMVLLSHSSRLQCTPDRASVGK